MRRFKFSLEKLLEHRKMQTDLAQKDYAAAVVKEKDQISRLSTMQVDLQDSIARLHRIQTRGGTVAEEIKSVHEYGSGQKVRISRQNRVVQGLRDISEQKRLVLVEAMKQVKTLEKLREKKKQEFDLEINRLEMKEIDEMTVMRHGRREAI